MRCAPSCSSGLRLTGRREIPRRGGGGGGSPLLAHKTTKRQRNIRSRRSQRFLVSDPLELKAITWSPFINISGCLHIPRMATTCLQSRPTDRNRTHTPAAFLRSSFIHNICVHLSFSRSTNNPLCKKSLGHNRQGKHFQCCIHTLRQKEGRGEEPLLRDTWVLGCCDLTSFNETPLCESQSNGEKDSSYCRCARLSARVCESNSFFHHSSTPHLTAKADCRQ